MPKEKSTKKKVTTKVNPKYLDSKTTEKILSQAQELDNEEEDEETRIRNIQELKQEQEAYENETFNELSKEEESIFDSFTKGNMADLIFSKFEQDVEVKESHLHPQVVKAYKKLAGLLSSYRSGKLPKAFSVLPTIENWEELLHLTKPFKWSYQVYPEAIKVFSSSANPQIAQRFYSTIFLPKLRQSILEDGKLNFHLYFSLKKSITNPGAFYKGLIIPLCEQECTSREAIVIGSVIQKLSIPILHSAAALLKISTLDYSGPNSYFIKILIDKKYALPSKVIDSIVNHFDSFENEKKELPVLWHQTLLSFVSIYHDLSKDQKAKLNKIIKIHQHYIMTPKIRKELNSKYSKVELKKDNLMEE
eukprot:gene1585-12710_t